MAAQNPNNQPSNDLSDVRTNGAANPNLSPTQLPIRGEKRIIPTPVNPNELSDAFNAQYTASGMDSPQASGYSGSRNQLVEQSDFYVSAALRPYIDYISIVIQNRGIDSQGVDDPTQNATFRFLINPSQVSISRSTIDTQAMSRAGWQFGVWGEDMIQVNLSGKTAGQYFAFGNTDQYLIYSQSYRNLEQLQVVFENNGYWFEGEQAAEGPLAADFTRRRIKMHQDVILNCGNFIWYGMFDTLQVHQSADSPFLMDFQLSFIAWKERFQKSSPYQNQIQNDIQRGNAYSVYQHTVSATSLQNLNNILPPSNSVVPTLASSTTNNPYTLSPAVNSFQQQALLPSTTTDVCDSVPATVNIPGTSVTPIAAAGPTPTSVANGGN